jgi:hypothetical protein
MARTRRKGRARPLVVAVLALVALGTGAWFLQQRSPHTVPLDRAPTAAAPAAISAERVDAANEGRVVAVNGSLEVAKPVRDAQLGISSADAAALLRTVEMLQWRECAPGDGCDYALHWSQQPIDSTAFKKGHDNPATLPFSSERFLANDIRLGAFKVDAVLAASAVESAAFPVHVAQLPPNLAATFRDHDGVLYAGADPDHGAVGDLRVSYHVVRAGPIHLIAIQDGDRLKSPPAR